MLKVYETTTAAGALAPISLAFEDGVLSIIDANGAMALPEGALSAVMAKFGGPLEPTSILVDVGRLDVGNGCTVRHVRHLARFDVIARDYIVYEAPGHDVSCALATTVAGALAHLARAVRC